MSTNTTGLSTTLAWMDEFAQEDRSGAMHTAYEKIVATANALRADRDNIELRDRIHTEAWELTEAWCMHRAKDDAGKDASEIGSWALAGAEQLWINTGLLDPALLQEFNEPDIVEMDLARMLLPIGGEDDCEIWHFSTYLLDCYRRRLGVGEHMRLQQKLEAARKVVAAARRALAACVADSREFLADNTNSDPEVLAKHGKLEVMLPFQAKMTALGQGGGGLKDRGTHRAHMKVTEATRTMLHAIEGRLGIYKLKKDFGVHYSEMLKRTIVLVEAEYGERLVTDEMAACGGLHFEVNGSDCLRAIEHSVGQLRQLAVRLADTPQFIAPPFVMEHLPRVNTKTATECFAEVIEACPRFKVATTEATHAPRILLLPGVGNAIFDKESKEIVATLYPIEARQTSLVGAIGESFLVDDHSTRTSYQRLRNLDSNSGKAFTDAFHRDFYTWVKTDWQARRNLTKEVHKWFHHNFIVRRSGE